MYSISVMKKVRSPYSMVPNSNMDVFIPADPAGGRFPVITSGTTAHCKNFTLRLGATCTVQTGGTLEIHGEAKWIRDKEKKKAKTIVLNIDFCSRQPGTVIGVGLFLFHSFVIRCSKAIAHEHELSNTVFTDLDAVISFLCYALRSIFQPGPEPCFH